MRAPSCIVLAGLVLGLALVGCGGHESEGGPEELVVGFLPLENPQMLAPQADAFADYLSEKLDLPVRAFVPTEYAPLVEALRGDRAHVAFMGSLATVMAHQLAGARPILGEIQRGEPFYHSQFYVRANSDIDSLEDLAGRSAAFTSPTGGSGFVFPIGLLVNEGLLESRQDPATFFDDVVFAGGDELVLRAVLRGDVDTGATSDYAPGLFLTPEERAQLRVIGRVQVPPHSVVVADELPADLVDRIRQALLDLAEPENIEILQNVYGAEGFVEVTIEDYESVVDAARAAGLDLETLLGS